MIRIQKEKCVKCLICLDVCPFTVLGAEEGYPKLKAGKSCLRCMHCAAACPQEAILFDEKDAILKQEITPLPNDFSRMLQQHILARRSYRHFKQKPVDRQQVHRALELASWAPSAKNQHPAKWMVIDSQDVIKRIMTYILDYVRETGKSPEILSEYENEGNNVVMGNAPALILCYARNNAINAPADTAIALTTAELFLQAEGIGTCWAGYLTRMCNDLPQIRKLLPELPENNSFYGALMIGYPQGENYLRIPERVKRADIQWI